VRNPMPELDQRFSDPGVQATPWREAEAALESAQLSWISTVRADGSPHVTPLVAVWLDGAAYFCTGPEERKAQNLLEHPQVVLLTGCNRWDGGLDVIVEGTAQRVLDPALLKRLAEAWRGKWDGRWRYQADPEGLRHPEGGYAVVYEVQPSKVLAFAKGAFGQTRYRPSDH
jgi:general stress protein 26